MFCGSCGSPVGFTSPPASSTPPPPDATPPGAAPQGGAPPPPGGPTTPPPMPPPMPPPPGVAYGTYRFQDPVTGAPTAEWWQRAVALIIDWAIFAIPTWIIVYVIVLNAITTTHTTAFGSYQTRSVGLLYVFDILFFLGYLAYYALLNGGEKGQTVGKMVMGIATRDESGQGPIGYGRAVGRFFIIVLFDILCFIPLILDYLSPLWDPRRQAWHDKVAHSLVINVR
jgi:uncharacterized RDD family membrane protein YckC